MRPRPTLALLMLSLCLLFTPAVLAQETDEAGDDGQAIAGHVLEMLSTKCNTCHGSHLAAPKGRFGHVLDLPRMAADPDLVEPGDADLSGLFWVMDDGSMPPKTSGIPAVTEEEKAAVRKWIEMGAPAASAEVVSAVNTRVAQTVAAPRPASQRPGGAASAVSTTDRLIEYAGRFHAAAVHFPIALLLAAAIAELIGAMRKTDNWQTTVRYCVWFGGLASVVATALGWANAADHSALGAQGALIDIHRWVGTVASILALLAIVAVERRAKHPCTATTSIVRVLLIVLVVGMSASGFLGGAIIYGIDHYAW